MRDKRQGTMDFSNPKLEKLIQKVEHEAASRPKHYRCKVFLFAIFGYLVVISFVLFVVALLSSVLFFLFDDLLPFHSIPTSWLMVSVIVFLASVLIFRSCAFKMESPKGYKIDAVDAPILFHEIEQLRSTLNLPKIHQVIIDSEFNAAMIQNPSMGLVQWYKNTLVLGLPLLMALPPEQARAVIAHEFGHLSGNHSRFSGWVYRVRETWSQVMTLSSKPNFMGGQCLRYFFEWYSPYFNAYTFVLARRNEFEADEVSARMTSVKDTSMALIATRVCSELLDENFWRPFFERADQEPKPGIRPFESLFQFCRSEYATNQTACQKIIQAMKAQTNYNDTHPALRERLKALGVQKIPRLKTVEESAAEKWLGRNLNGILHDFDENWLHQNQQHWRDRYCYVKDSRRQLTLLKNIPSQQLTPQQRWQLAAWIEEFEPEKDPLPHYEFYKSVCCDDPDVDYAIGRLMLERGNVQGLSYLEKVLHHEKMVLSACETAYSFCCSRGEVSLAEKWKEIALKHRQVECLANAERTSVKPTDNIIRCSLNTKSLSLISLKLLEAKFIKHLWIAEKQVLHFPSRPVYVVVFECSSAFYTEKKVIDYLSQLIKWPGLTFVAKRGGNLKCIAEQVIEKGSQLL